MFLLIMVLNKVLLQRACDNIDNLEPQEVLMVPIIHSQFL